MFAIPVLAALSGGASYHANAPYVATDDAFVRANGRGQGWLIWLAIGALALMLIFSR